MFASQDNIVLGSQYDERRYQEVLHDCALLTDIKQWSDGDATVVGERGTALRYVRATLAAS